MLDKPDCVAPTGDRCGEGPVWHAADGSLYWTDINRFLIHRFNPADQSVRSWFFDEPVTALCLTSRSETIAVVLGSGVILWEPATGLRKQQIFKLDGWPRVRLNDGRPDPRGSLWIGSMRNNVQPDGSAGKAGGKDGALYRVDPQGCVTEFRKGLGIANTVAWSPDSRHFYFADTLANSVWRFDYDPDRADIGNETRFFCDFERGLPDGSAVDAEGYLWNCRSRGGCIVRVAPDGKIDRIVEMPVKNVTSCTFGGRDRTTLYITTAALGAPPNERLAGSLYALRTRVPGLPENRFLLAE
jgi:sugar lactone lactonase YvrE